MGWTAQGGRNRICVDGPADRALPPETALDEHLPKRLQLKMLSARWPRILPKALEFVMTSSFFRAMMPCLMQNEASSTLSSSEADGSKTAWEAAVSLQHSQIAVTLLTAKAVTMHCCFQWGWSMSPQVVRNLPCGDRLGQENVQFGKRLESREG